MSKHKTRKEIITLELEGVKYTGYRIITGIDRLQQKIYFNESSRSDFWIYNSDVFVDTEKVMRQRAVHILRELVKESNSVLKNDALKPTQKINKKIKHNGRYIILSLKSKHIQLILQQKNRHKVKSI